MKVIMLLLFVRCTQNERKERKPATFRVNGQLMIQSTTKIKCHGIPISRQKQKDEV